MSNMHAAPLRSKLSDVETAMARIPADRHETCKFKKLARQKADIEGKLRKCGVTLN